MQAFNYDLNFKEIDFRKVPELYKIGRGEQGVLSVEPYKSEILPYWKFRTPAEAKISAAAISKMFRAYRKENDFIGMDMSRKFLQMGYTRSRRYANHRSGKKYDGPVPADKKGQSGAHGRKQLPDDRDEVKAASAEIFFAAWQKIKDDKKYIRLSNEHREMVSRLNHT